MRLALGLAGISVALGACAAQSARALVPAATAKAAPAVSVYYAANGKPDVARAIQARHLTHIVYAFVTLCGDHPSFVAAEKERRAKVCKGRKPNELAFITEPNHRSELMALAAHKGENPNLQLIASVGGWAMPLFPAAIKTPETRATFVRSAIAFLRAHPQFDGIDLDWEYPGGGDNERKLLAGATRTAEAAAYRSLARELRTALTREGARQSRKYLLTAAVAGYPRSILGVNWPRTQQYFDHIFVMTYDFTPEKSFAVRGDFSGGGGLPGHHSNLHAIKSTEGYGADAMIANLANAGVPRGKMAIGAGFYGREWKNVDSRSDKYPAASSSGDFVGTPTYVALKARDLRSEGFSYGYDTEAQAAYYASGRGFISFEDVRSICAKAEWAKQQGLGGIFAWEASQDDGTLTDAMVNGLRGTCSR